MGCQRGSRGCRRLLATALAGVLALTGCSRDGSTDPPDESATNDQPDAPDEDRPDENEPEPITDEEAVTASYERFLTTLTAAMEAGDPALPELAEAADGQGLVNAQAMVVSLVEAERIARGEFISSIEAIDVDGDAATIEDCYRVDLVEFDRDTDEQVADRGGARFQASAQLVRESDDDWIVTDFVEGDVCAPTEIATTVEDRYLAHWDAVWDAADPANPDHPGLADTAAGEHLAGLQEQLGQLREAGHVRRGRGTEHPTVVLVTSHDTEALVRDCVEENPDGGVYDATTGELIEDGTPPGQRTLLETRLELLHGDWRVVNVQVEEEDSGCEPDAS